MSGSQTSTSQSEAKLGLERAVEKAVLGVIREFSLSQRYVCATALYYMVLKYCRGGASPPMGLNSREIGPVIRNWERKGLFPESFNYLKTPHGETHKKEAGGTQCFQFVRMKGWITHVSTSHYKYSSKFKELAMEALIAVREEEQDSTPVTEAVCPPSPSGIEREILEAIRSIEWKFDYRGIPLSRDLYKKLSDENVNGLGLTAIRDGEVLGVADFARFMFSLAELS